MFERNPVDNKAETLIAVEVAMADGSKVAGRAVLAPGKGVHKLLEGEGAFVYVDGFDGEGAFLPKAEIRGLKVIQPGKPQATALSIPDARHFDPHRILGLQKGASFEEIRDAYHRLSKLYHPDLYASVALPKEVKTYLDAMSKNVNAAFRALRYVGEKQAPVYTRGG
jgi:DnaJ-domain-containing protein 1